MNKEILERAKEFHRRIEESERNLNLVNEQIYGLENFKEQLSFLENSQEKDILSSFGKGVFIKAKIGSEKLLVNVGGGIVVEKTLKEVSEIVAEQIKRFYEARVRTTAEIEICAAELKKIIGEIEKSKEQHEA